MYTLKQFFDKFGTDTTNNIELMNYAKMLGIKNFYYVMRDEMKLLPLNTKFPLNVMTNIHTSDQPGVHHNCFYICDSNRYFFDSYGLAPTKEVEKYMRHGEHSTFRIQEDNTTYCGQLSLYFLYLMNHTDKSYHDVILSISAALENFSIKK